MKPVLALCCALLLAIGGVLVVVPLAAIALFGALVVRWARKLRTAIAERNQADEARYGFMLETLHRFLGRGIPVVPVVSHDAIALALQHDFAPDYQKVIGKAQRAIGARHPRQPSPPPSARSGACRARPRGARASHSRPAAGAPPEYRSTRL